MKRYLLPVSVLGILAVVGLVGGYRFLREKVARSSVEMLASARESRDAGDLKEAIDRYHDYLRYVGNRADTRQATAEYAALLIQRMSAPGAIRRFAGDLPAVETAVLKNPDDLGLRLGLAQCLMAIRRFADARVHLLWLREAIGRNARPSPTAADEPTDRNPPDRDAIDLMLATAWAGSGDPRQAAAILAEAVGFRLDSGRFADSSAKAGEPTTPPPAARSTTELFLMLEGLLRDKLKQPAAADAVLDRCVVDNPDDATAWMRYAGSKTAGKDVAKARDGFAKVRQLAAEDDPRGLLADVQLKMLEEKRAEAAAALENARRSFPKRDEVLETASRCADRWRDGGLALSVLDDCIERYGPRPLLVTMISGMPIAAADIEAVQSRFDALRKQASQGNVVVPMLEARLLMARKQWFAARRILEGLRPEVAANNEVKRRVDLHLAACSWNLGDHDQQLAAYKRMGAFTSDRLSWIVARLQAAIAMASTGQQENAVLEVRAIDGAFKSLLPAQVQEMLRRPEDPLRLRADLVAFMPERQRHWSLVEALLKAMAEDPDVEPARLAAARACVLARQNKPDAAIAVLAAALEAAPEDASLQAASLDLVLAGEGPGAARNRAAGAAEAVRGDPLFLLAEARTAAAAPIDRPALDAIAKRALGIADPAESARVLRELASLAAADGRGDEARRLWKAAAERLPDDLRAPLELLEMGWRDGDVAQARLAADAILQLTGQARPEHRTAEAAVLVAEVRSRRGAAGTLSFKGLLQPDKERLKQARLLVTETENARPAWPTVHRLVAEMDLFEGNTKAAIDQLVLARQLAIDKRPVTRRLLALLHGEERFTEAEEILESLGPADLRGLERIAVDLRLRQDRVADAVAIALQAVPDDSENVDDLLWCGDLLLRAGEHGPAERAIARAAELAPQRSDIWLSLMGRQLADGRRDAAEQTLHRGRDAVAGRQRSRLLARGSVLLGRDDEAELHFRQALADNPTDIGVAGDAVDFYLQHGRATEARELLETIVDSTGTEADDLDAQFWARRRLAEMNKKSKPAAASR